MTSWYTDTLCHRANRTGGALLRHLQSFAQGSASSLQSGMPMEDHLDEPRRGTVRSFSRKAKIPTEGRHLYINSPGGRHHGKDGQSTTRCSNIKVSRLDDLVSDRRQAGGGLALRRHRRANDTLFLTPGSCIISLPARCTGAAVWISKSRRGKFSGEGVPWQNPAEQHGRASKKIATDMDRDYYMSAEEAQRFGNCRQGHRETLTEEEERPAADTSRGGD